MVDGVESGEVVAEREVLEVGQRLELRDEPDLVLRTRATSSSDHDEVDFGHASHTVSELH